jgi:hypothetical protein
MRLFNVILMGLAALFALGASFLLGESLHQGLYLDALINAVLLIINLFMFVWNGQMALRR